MGPGQGTVPREDAMKRTISLLLAALMGLASAAYAADTTPAKPSAKTAQAAKASSSSSDPQAKDKSHTGGKGATPQRARAKPSRVTTGDEDLEDLEVQRQKLKQRWR
jgi:hypothetical protein